MRFLWSVLVWIAIAAITVVCATLVLLSVALLWPIDRNRRVGQLFSTLWGEACFRVNPRWKLEVRNGARFHAAHPCVLAANHSSQVDILAISALHGQWRWVSKSIMFWFPFLGWAMKAIGTPGVRRGDKESGQKMLAHCRRWLDRGVSILIFPEGTRSKDGELQAFKPGGFKLALDAKKAIVPVVVVGANEALPKKGIDLSRRAYVVVSVLEAVDTTPWQASFDVEGLSNHVRGLMGDELRRLKDERAKTVAVA